MTSADLNQTTTGTTTIKNFSVAPQILESPNRNEETFYDNPNYAKNLGYYKTIPEYKKALDALGIWACGKGWTTTDSLTQTILENITGNGKQNFQQIMISHLKTKKNNGDSYIHIIRHNNGTLLNLKLLNPSRIRVVYSPNGIILRYEQLDLEKTNVLHTFDPEEILHSINEPVGDETHGVSALEACKEVIDTRNEVMADIRRFMHLSTIRVMYIDADDPNRINQVKTQYAEAIKKGTLLIIPAKKGEAEFQDLSVPPIEAHLSYVRYLEDFFYTAVGIKKLFMGGSNQETQTDNKMGYMTFDPVYSTEQLELEADLWNQVGIKVDFNRPVELGGLMNENEEKNTGQIGMQANEINPEAEE